MARLAATWQGCLTFDGILISLSSRVNGGVSHVLEGLHPLLEAVQLSLFALLIPRTAVLRLRESVWQAQSSSILNLKIPTCLIACEATTQTQSLQQPGRPGALPRWDGQGVRGHPNWQRTPELRQTYYG